MAQEADNTFQAMADQQPADGRIIVGLSGGVDSAVAAMLLQRKGYDVRGLFMKSWEEDDDAEHCAAKEDLATARKVADKLDIPLETVNFASEYWERVFAHFLSELKAGRTPNPDVLCNREIKFQAFLDYALSKGAEKIATGHYACSQRHPTTVELRRAADADKDQTYFLHQVTAGALMKTLFPLCRYKKPEVREIAKAARLANHNRKDSTGICFIGKRRFNDFVEKYIANEPGPVLSVTGAKIGEHRGLVFHTIGQRKGLGIGGLKDTSGEPWFVADKLADTNTLIVAQGRNHPALFARGLTASSLHWIAGKPTNKMFKCTARTRHRQKDTPCEVTINYAGSCQVVFSQPARAIAPGQSVVFYDGEVCLGGGMIEAAIQ